MDRQTDTYNKVVKQHHWTLNEIIKSFFEVQYVTIVTHQYALANHVNFLVLYKFSIIYIQRVSNSVFSNSVIPYIRGWKFHSRDSCKEL